MKGFAARWIFIFFFEKALTASTASEAVNSAAPSDIAMAAGRAAVLPALTASIEAAAAKVSIVLIATTYISTGTSPLPGSTSSFLPAATKMSATMIAESTVISI